jgi:dTDP-4-amino-4,6-dideoxygalactose transaminase
MKGFQYLGYKEGDFPVSENLSQTIVSLPMHPYLSSIDIEEIVQALNSKGV